MKLVDVISYPIIAVIPENVLLLYFHASPEKEHQALKPAVCIGASKRLPVSLHLKKTVNNSKTVDTCF